VWSRAAVCRLNRANTRRPSVWCHHVRARISAFVGNPWARDPPTSEEVMPADRPDTSDKRQHLTRRGARQAGGRIRDRAVEDAADRDYARRSRTRRRARSVRVPLVGVAMALLSTSPTTARLTSAEPSRSGALRPGAGPVRGALKGAVRRPRDRVVVRSLCARRGSEFAG
jgi:hypothetical protein